MTKRTVAVSVSLDVRLTVSRGLSRAATTTGAVLALVFIGLDLLLLAVPNESAFGVVTIEASRGTGLVLPVPPAVASAIGTIGSVIGLVLVVALSRAMVRDADDLSSFPTDVVTRRPVRAVISTIGAAILVVISVGLGAMTVGSLIVVIPALVLFAAGDGGGSVPEMIALLPLLIGLSVSFLLFLGAVVAVGVVLAFVVTIIAVEDRRAIDAVNRNWDLVSRDRTGVIVLAAVLFGLYLLAGLVGFAVATGGQLVADLYSALASGVLIVVTLAIVAEAYRQLRDEPPRPNALDLDSTGERGTAVDREDLDRAGY